MENQPQNNGERQPSGIPKKFWYAGGLLLVLILALGLGTWLSRTNVAGSQEKGRRVLYYVDPMNPSHTSPEPGLAPCGMKMEPVYADEEDVPDGLVLSPGSVKITPEKQQLLGVKLAKVEPSPWTFTLRSTGRVAVDETRVYRLNAYAEGWIVKVYDNSTGSLVRKDEPLARYYNRDVAAALQTYYHALDAVEQTRQNRQGVGGSEDQLVSQQMAAKGLLMNLGMSKRQLDELTRSRKLTQEVVIAPMVTSFVLNRNISQGQRFDKGEEFYRLADLSKVWILADVYGNEAKYIKAGEVVKVSIPSQEEVYEARVSEVLPQFDTAALTLKVRLIVDNPDFDLKPGMFVDVNFPISLPPSLNIPIDAVMDTGIYKTIFIYRGSGFFEPRRVKTGWRLGDHVEIKGGLNPGEQIAVSGNFLIDSESRMKLAAAGFYGEITQDPVCNLNIDTNKAATLGLKRDIQGKSYYFCSESCRKQFDLTPERYVTQDHAGVLPESSLKAASKKDKADMVKDPVCGLRVPRETAREAGRSSDYQGVRYYFDTDGCKQRFDQDPQQYLREKADDPLVPPNPYDYKKVQTNPAVQIPFRRKILPSNPPVPDQSLQGLRRLRISPRRLLRTTAVVRSPLQSHSPRNRGPSVQVMASQR